MATPKSPRRSLLFTPADSLRKLEKGAQLGNDTIILDLEDAVAPDRKAQARDNLVTALAGIDFGKTECLVRVNSPDTEYFTADLEAVAGAIPDGIVIPKVTTAAQIHTAADYLTAVEQSYGRASGSIRIFALIETALGVMNLKEIAQASPRLDGLLFGAEDLAVNLGTSRTKAGWEIYHARAAVVMSAAAYGLQAIDMVFVDLHDVNGLKEEAVFARQLGYLGKMAIHPGQTAIINQVFSPTVEEVERAQQLVAAYQAQAAAGSGAFALDGRMVDKPIVLAAEQLLQRARLCQLFDE